MIRSFTVFGLGLDFPVIICSRSLLFNSWVSIVPSSPNGKDVPLLSERLLRMGIKLSCDVMDFVTFAMVVSDILFTLSALALDTDGTSICLSY